MISVSILRSQGIKTNGTKERELSEFEKLLCFILKYFVGICFFINKIIFVFLYLLHKGGYFLFDLGQPKNMQYYETVILKFLEKYFPKIQVLPY